MRRGEIGAAAKAYEPERLADASRGLLRTPPPVDTSHMARITVSLEPRRAGVRDLRASRRTFTFEDAVGDSDRMTQAVTLFALLELYKSGELVWRQRAAFGEVETMTPPDTSGLSRDCAPM